MVLKKKALESASPIHQDQRSPHQGVAKQRPLNPSANPEHKALNHYSMSRTNPRPLPRPRPQELDFKDNRLLDESPSVLSTTQGFHDPATQMAFWPQSCPSSFLAPPTFPGPRVGPQWRRVPHPHAAAVVDAAKMLGNYLGGRFQMPSGGFDPMSNGNRALGQPTHLPPLEDTPILGL